MSASRKQRPENGAASLLPNPGFPEPGTANSQMETCFPRMDDCEGEYNQRQKRLPFLTGAVCVVGSVQAAG